LLGLFWGAKSAFVIPTRWNVMVTEFVSAPVRRTVVTKMVMQHDSSPAISPFEAVTGP